VRLDQVQRIEQIGGVTALDEERGRVQCTGGMHGRVFFGAQDDDREIAEATVFSNKAEDFQVDAVRILRIENEDGRKWKPGAVRVNADAAQIEDRLLTVPCYRNVGIAVLFERSAQGADQLQISLNDREDVVRHSSHPAFNMNAAMASAMRKDCALSGLHIA
jgi:hypothetical protein